MKPILYYAEKCPDTAPFVAELKRLGVEYDEVEVMSSIPNLKQWLRLRDNNAAFDAVKAKGNAGFPALLLEDGRVILTESELRGIFA
ncbi:hypothetical protein HYE60_04255 [Aggregatibacter actinomycetemcomitans]|uniref:hypothetical protein n=1 Tax=Aggregatibacter actinomycetemcomitans TaxID=714 RepID=UPI00197BF760|nr:hypothetical protein [Aggregatibacter actinomycetemcomitans]MBN6074473.1 hypothetical protein [Aggregatibacter actinomycetemcomitans]